MRAGLATAVPASALLKQAAKAQTAALPSPSNMPIDTFVVLMQENRSFDHYFGWRTDADAKNAGLTYPDDQGVPHPTHPLAPDFQGCAFEDPDHSWDRDAALAQLPGYIADRTEATEVTEVAIP